MNKIIGTIQPFDKNSTFHIYNDGQIITTFQSSIENLPSVILQKVKTYQIEEINLSGSKTFIEGLSRKIIDNEPYYFTKNKIIINCI